MITDSTLHPSQWIFHNDDWQCTAPQSMDIP